MVVVYETEASRRESKGDERQGREKERARAIRQARWDVEEVLTRKKRVVSRV